MREIAYTLRFPEAAAHRVEVEARVPAEGAPAVELMMPVWTPGSYLVRELARQVETIAAADPAGRPLAIEKTRKNRWRIETAGAAEVIVRYRLYARELSVRTNFVDAGFALLNGTATFLTRLDRGRPAAVPHRVTLELPEDWRRAFCALPATTPGPSAHAAFVAPDYDALVDAPIYAGDPEVRRFDVGRAEIVLVDERGGPDAGGPWDSDRAARDLEAIVRAQAALWGGLPFGRFFVLNLLTGEIGGLEHADSTVLTTSRWKAATEKGWREWLGLASHELFHAWNGKRLRPVELGPFDYEAEVTTRSLWFVEGVTAYYDDLMVRRAGLSSEAQYLATLGDTAERVETAPGRDLQSLAESSFDAWIKFYRRDENSANHTVSYYAKGSLVAWLLDARLRRATGDAKGLDDLLRRAWKRFPPGRGYRPDDLYALAAELGGDEVGGWLREAVEGSGALDYAPALDAFGLRFVDRPREGDGEEGGGGARPAGGQGEAAEADGGTAAGEAGANGGGAPGRAWLGARADLRDGRLIVTEVRRGTPAFAAGVNVDDELLAIDGFRLPPRGFAERLAGYRPEQTVELLVARRERLSRLAVTLGAEPARPWRLEADPDATPEQRARRAAWLGNGPT